MPTRVQQVSIQFSNESAFAALFLSYFETTQEVATFANQYCSMHIQENGILEGFSLSAPCSYLVCVASVHPTSPPAHPFFLDDLGIDLRSSNLSRTLKRNTKHS